MTNAQSTEALFAAIDAQDLEAAAQAVAHGADLEAKGTDGATVLVRATKNRDTPLALLLIEAGANVNAKDNLEDSAYLYAGAEGLNDILKATLSHGADVRSTNRYGGTALIPASEHGYTETIKLLLDAGVPVDHINNLGWTALHEAITLGDGGPDQVQAVRLLLEGGADPTIPDSNGLSPRELAEERGYTRIIVVLDSHL